MVGGIENILDVPSRTVDFSDGDRIEVVGPIKDTKKGYSLHLYRNEDTRALDEKFGLNGNPISEDFVESLDPINLFIGQHNLGDKRVSATLALFVHAAYQVGYFIGFDEEDIRKINPSYFHQELALTHKNWSHGPYLVGKEVEGHYILFPKGLPLASMALPDKAVA